MYLPRSRRNRQREQEDQREEADVELALHRHRPDVLQGADRLAGAQIVRCGARQLPVLVVAEAGQALVGEGLPPGLRLHQDGEHRRCGEHHDERGQQPSDQPGHLGNGPQRRAGRQRGSQQASAEKESRKRQEDVDTARDTAEPDVEHRHERDGDAAEAVEIVSVETGLPVSRRRPALGPSAVTGAGRGGARVIMVDRQIYRRSRDTSCSGRRGVTRWHTIRLVLHARVDAR